ncbi:MULTISPECIES: RNA polymerase sigma factor [Actinoallomurus]|uniref:RNA polymerase sigma factor n=1 Tax=Actinoallomurus TaxID=667113 RepID=UPI0020907F7C|nr:MULTISPECIES: sigma-70 family RNA polymerase sigma factor [Actinoallomurus]MCO5970738.1 sigma-70 family RNA polymerase sigma factor [Actinoallomurus soli]MCO5993651.1 sigma-70 family RNA polymerase sigma factor [Actinoallomurus rhizosphaericola]
MECNETGELVRRARAGDPAAWRALVDRYSRLLYAIARSYGLSGADIDDVVQTTWLRLVERLPRLRDPARAGAWLAVTARRESQAVLRRRGRERPLTGHTPTVTGPHHAVFGRELAGSVAAALDTVPPRCRALLELSIASPRLSYAEISTALGVPLGSVGPTRTRCLLHLRRRLGVA